jgi:hypothetical protein
VLAIVEVPLKQAGGGEQRERTPAPVTPAASEAS